MKRRIRRGSSCMVTITILGGCGSLSILRIASSAPMPGISRSSSTTSGLVSETVASARSWVFASPATSMSSAVLSISARPRRNSWWSSQRTTLMRSGEPATLIVKSSPRIVRTKSSALIIVPRSVSLRVPPALASAKRDPCDWTTAAGRCMSVGLSCAACWARMRGRMGEADTIRGVWSAAVAIIRRYPLAVLAPAVVFGALGEIPAYLIEGRPLLDQTLTLVTAYVAYYLYLAYAEGVVRKARRGTQRLGLRSVIDDLIEASPFVPSVLVAALISLTITTLATSLLAIPGMWLYTRWSLATPVIREESIGPLAATQQPPRARSLLAGVYDGDRVLFSGRGGDSLRRAGGRGGYRVAHVGGMGGRFARGDAGRAPGGLRDLPGPLEPCEASLTRCHRDLRCRSPESQARL